MDSRQRVAIVVAHELAHQWFGNLVVCYLIFENKYFVLFLIFRLWIGGLIYVKRNSKNFILVMMNFLF
jgi:hypothetical protein